MTGRHTAAVPDKLSNGLKLVFIMDWFYIPSDCLSRASVILLYLRVFIRKSVRTLCWIVLGMLVCNAVGVLIATVIECIPLEFTWDKTIQGGWCFNTLAYWRLTNVPNIVIDVAILLLPLETLWNLQTSLSRKLGIAFAFLMGSIGLIASSVRTSKFYLADFSDPGCKRRRFYDRVSLLTCARGYG